MDIRSFHLDWFYNNLTTPWWSLGTNPQQDAILTMLWDEAINRADKGDYYFIGRNCWNVPNEIMDEARRRFPSIFPPSLFDNPYGGTKGGEGGRGFRGLGDPPLILY
jgi:hypothetical protein